MPTVIYYQSIIRAIYPHLYFPPDDRSFKFFEMNLSLLPFYLKFLLLLTLAFRVFSLNSRYVLIAFFLFEKYVEELIKEMFPFPSRTAALHLYFLYRSFTYRCIAQLTLSISASDCKISRADVEYGWLAMIKEIKCRVNRPRIRHGQESRAGEVETVGKTRGISRYLEFLAP